MTFKFEPPYIESLKMVEQYLYVVAGVVVRDTWAKLRNCHRDALRRRKKILKSGAAANAIKQWRFQDKMSFLLPFITKRMIVANLTHSDDEHPAAPINEIANIQVSEVSENLVSSVMDYENISSGNNENGNMVIEDSQNKGINNPVQQTILNYDQRAYAEEIEYKKLANSKFPVDSLFLFFISMYHSAQKLSPEIQLKVKNIVFETLSQAEANLLNIPETSTQNYIDELPQSTSTWQYVEDISSSQNSVMSNNCIVNQSDISQSDLTNYYNSFQS